MSRIYENLNQFAEFCYELQKSDRDVNIAVGGMTGEGKTTFLTKLAKAHSKYSGIPWDMSMMTWSREELMTWIDGKGKEKVGQQQEYSFLLCDELFGMFYKRRWYESVQIDAITTLNMCRERHLLIAGAVPKFWDLDIAFVSRIRFYIFIPERGKAWIFQQENNPFSTDAWNVMENKMKFRLFKSVEKIPNFICEVSYDDWDEEEKKAYLEIRAIKRVDSIEQNGSSNEKNKKIRRQRDILIKLLAEKYKETQQYLGDLIGLDQTVIGKIVRGEIGQA